MHVQIQIHTYLVIHINNIFHFLNDSSPIPNKTPAGNQNGSDRSVPHSSVPNGGSNNQTPLGKNDSHINQEKDYSERREHNSSRVNELLSDFDSEMRTRTTRVTLFEKSVLSPDMSPILSVSMWWMCLCIFVRECMYI